MNSQTNKESGGQLETRALMACLKVGKLLTSTLHLKEILELIMQKVSELIPAQNWSLLLMDAESSRLCFEVVVGIDSKLIEDVCIDVGEGIAGEVAQNGECIISEDASNDPRVNRTVDQRTGFQTKSIIALPLKIHGKILGVMEVVNFPDVESFRKKYLPVLEILADYAAIAIENSRSFQQIQEMSIRDEYTGLHNARYLHEILGDLISDCEKKKAPLSAVFMDVDNFKTVVDAFGHLSGSQVLKEVGETISGCLTGDDLLIKYGGDEYVLILPGRDKEAARQIAENILDEIRKTTYLKSEAIPVKLTASFGIAAYPEDAQTKKDLLLLADNTMYRIKKSSKNGVGVN